MGARAHANVSVCVCVCESIPAKTCRLTEDISFQNDAAEAWCVCG